MLDIVIVLGYLAGGIDSAYHAGIGLLLIYNNEVLAACVSAISMLITSNIDICQCFLCVSYTVYSHAYTSLYTANQAKLKVQIRYCNIHACR